MVMLCRYKPCTLWILFHGVFAILFLIFTTAMYMFIGGFYPSRRLEICWHWAMIHNTASIFVSGFTCVCIYRNMVRPTWNVTLMSIQLVLCISAGALSGTIWPVVEQQEFEAYIQNYQKTHLQIPQFLEWFQYSQGCCGVVNYRDYIHFFGTQLEYEKYHVAYRVSPISPNFRPMEPGEVLPVDAKRIKKVVFTVPRSCCHGSTVNTSACGQNIDYTNPAEIEKRVNSIEKGCYKLFRKLMYEYKPVQIMAMYVVFRATPLVDVVFHIVALFVHCYYYDIILKGIHAPEDIVYDPNIMIRIDKVLKARKAMGKKKRSGEEGMTFKQFIHSTQAEGAKSV